MKSRISLGKSILETRVPRNLIEKNLTEISKIRWNEDAGGFVCNETYFRSLLASEERPLPVVLFIHLPSENIIPLEEQFAIISLICESLNKTLISVGSRHLLFPFCLSPRSDDGISDVSRFSMHRITVLAQCRFRLVERAPGATGTVGIDGRSRERPATSDGRADL